MSRFERRVAFLLAGIFSTRMLGLFMILPVFALYAREIEAYSPFLVGVALGIYGLTQALFQVPLGLLSDRIGRKPVILAGLLVFAIGSVVAALADTMWGIILGRALQGAGAIASAVMALAADLTREEHRVKVMALIGISIGASFALALVVGPLLHAWGGLSGIFWSTAILALLGILLVLFKVPRPAVSRFRRDTEVELDWVGQALRHPQLLRLDLSIFILHFVLMASFVVVPLMLSAQMSSGVSNHWKVYLPVLLLSMLAVSPFILMAEKKHKIKQVLVSAIAVLALAQLGFSQLGSSFTGLVFVLWLFFTAFNLLEAMLPSLVSKIAPAAHKGTAMGAYSTAQFLGVFFGGLAGGWVAGEWGSHSVFLLNAGLALVWLLLVWKMPQPQYLSSYMLNVGIMAEAKASSLADSLSRVEGVEEALVIAAEGVAYLKVDMDHLDMERLNAYSVASTEQSEELTG
jgi:MFS family permease